MPTTLNAQLLKKDFPILSRCVNSKRLVYLDSASTSQKPRTVIDTIAKYYMESNSNIHRGIHSLSEEATAAYEGVRAHVARFINAGDSAEIIFTRNTTEAINLVAYSWGEKNIRSGNEIVVSALEHHSNLVPWQELCRRKRAVLRYIPLDKDYQLDLSDLENIITNKTRLIAVTQMSNVLGTIVPLEKIIAAARKVGATTMVDGAQGVGHLGIDVQKLDCDFLAFSSHKMLGPTGVGVLYGKKAILEKMPPFLFGGDMVKEVNSFEAKWNDLPWKFEAGTPNIADVIAFGEALSYLEKIGFDQILKHDRYLLAYTRYKLASLSDLQFYGPKNLAQTGGILSFNVPNVHPHDVAAVLNEEGIAIRAGHHCAQPLIELLKVPAVARLSFYLYNNEADIDAVYSALEKVYVIFKSETAARRRLIINTTIKPQLQKYGSLRRNHPGSLSQSPSLRQAEKTHHVGT